MRPPLATSLAAAALVAGGAVTADHALAHAPPLGTGLWWIPSSSSGATASATSERLVIRTPRGFLIQAGAANDLRLLCNEAVGIQDGEEASFAYGQGHGLLVTTFGRGLLRGSMDGCRWDPVAAVTTAPAFDVVVASTGGAATAFVVSGMPHQGEHFWAGRDDGAAWSPLANSDMPYTRLRAAPSDPARIYLSGIGVSAAGTAVHRLGVSDDAGHTVVERTIALGPGDLQARVLGVDPLRPEHVYVWVESNSVEIPERLLVSDDRGATFTAVATLHELRGFSQSDDGRQVWVGGAEGVLRSTDGGATFAPLTTSALTKITCLAFHRNQLYGCGVLDKQLVVAVSDDGGATFRKVFSFEQVTQPVACAEDNLPTSPATACAPSLEHWRTEFGTLPVPEPPATTPPVTTTDAGTGARPSSSGCAVGGGAGAGHGGAAGVAALLAALAGLRSGRRAARRNRGDRRTSCGGRRTGSGWTPADRCATDGCTGPSDRTAAPRHHPPG
jgi:hypothetical protein